MRHNTQTSASRRTSVIRGHWIVLVKGMLMVSVGAGIIFFRGPVPPFPSSFVEFISPNSAMDLQVWVSLLCAASILYGIIDLVAAGIWLATSRVVLRKNGLEWVTGVNQHAHQVKYANIESPFLYRSLLGRILNYGTLTVYGVGSGTIVMPNIRKAKALKDYVDQQIELINADEGDQGREGEGSV